jgi:hypothetical protein
MTYRVFPYSLGSYTTATIAFPSAIFGVDAGTYDIKVSGKAAVSGGDNSTLYVKNCTLVASQG